MTTGESCAHGAFPAQLLSEGSLLALGDSGHGVLLSPPSLHPLEYRASCSRQQRVCVTVRWDLTQPLMVCLCLCYLEGRSVPHHHCPVVNSKAQLSLPLIVPPESSFQTHSAVWRQASVFSWMFSWERVVVQCHGGVRVNRFCQPARP